jgi:type I restriction enzyme S subunit
MALKKSELYSSLWASCDELRGGMDASQYKDYVLVLLFIKYVSDKYAGIRFAPITVPAGSSFKDMAALKGKADIGEGTRGACGIVGSPAATNQSCMAIYPSEDLSTAFLYHYYVLRGKALALEYCQGTKQQSYTAKLVRLLPITIPPTMEEQIAIATVLSDMDCEIRSVETRLAKARQLKQGMMQELLTGRIRLI